MTKPKRGLIHRSSSPSVAVAIVVAVCLVAVGAIIVAAIWAAGTPTAVEAEAGVLAGPATKTTDATAAGGQAVKFGSSTSPSGAAMPTGDLPGWHQIVAEDFTTPAPSGSFVSTYTNTWCPYNDAQGGYYQSVLSAHDGLMDISLDGTKGAAGAFGIHSAQNYCATLYGRYSIRFKVVDADSYGTAMMIWPNSGIWADGEIDYPEGNFNGTMHINHHTMDPVKCGDTNGCSEKDYSLDTGVGFHAWHTATTEWLPDKVNYYLDGTLLHTVTTSVPQTNHRMTIQMAPVSTPVTTGHFLIDWVTIYAQQ